MTRHPAPPLQVRTLREGHGRPLLLLHAFPLDHRMWHPVVAALPHGRPVLAVDTYGAGDAPVVPTTPSLDVVADAVRDALDVAGYGPVAVAGLSMGGYVALALAERHPDIIRGLALLDTKSSADSTEARERRLRVADELLTERSVSAVLGMAASLPSPESVSADPTLTARIEENILAQRPEGLAWCQRAMAARPDRTAVLGGLAGPVLVLVGEEDPVTPVSDAEHMVVARRDAELIIVPGVGHLSALEAPTAVAEALAAFAARCDPA